MPSLSPDEVVRDARAARRPAAHRAARARRLVRRRARASACPTCCLVESHYRADDADRRARVRRPRSPRDIRSDALSGTSVWRRMHELRAERHDDRADPRRPRPPSRRGGASPRSHPSRTPPAGAATPAGGNTRAETASGPSRGALRTIGVAAGSHPSTKESRMSPSAAAAVSAAELVKTYPGGRGTPPVRALDGLSLEIAAGSVFALLGPNGAGKSTTVKHPLDALAPRLGPRGGRRDRRRPRPRRASGARSASSARRRRATRWPPRARTSSSPAASRG